jgi:hypothetical protein
MKVSIKIYPARLLHGPRPKALPKFVPEKLTGQLRGFVFTKKVCLALNGKAGSFVWFPSERDTLLDLCDKCYPIWDIYGMSYGFVKGL